MASRKKGAVRDGHGAMCNICGMNCGKGGALSRHIESVHAPVKHDAYNICFYSKPKNVLCNCWDDSVTTKKGRTVLTHTLVRRFIQEPGPRGATRAARTPRV